MQRVVPTSEFASILPHALPGEMIPFEVPELAPGDGHSLAPTDGGVSPLLPTVEEGAARLVRSPVKLLIIGGPDGGQSMFLFKVSTGGDGHPIR